MHHRSEVLIILVCFYRGLCFMERDIEIVEIVNVSFLSMYFGNILCEKKRLMTHSFERYRVLFRMFSTPNYVSHPWSCYALG